MWEMKEVFGTINLKFKIKMCLGMRLSHYLPHSYLYLNEWKAYIIIKLRIYFKIFRELCTEPRIEKGMDLTNFGLSCALIVNCCTPHSVFKLNSYKNCMKYLQISLQQIPIIITKSSELICAWSCRQVMKAKSYHILLITCFWAGQ